MRCLKISVATAILGLCASGIASAGGLYISEESAASNVAYGGVQFVARQTDASVVFSNPAGMTSFDKSELTAGGTLLYLHGPFSTDDDNTISGTSGRATEVLALGNAQYVRPLNDKWSFGVHAGNYFGLLLNWGSAFLMAAVVYYFIISLSLAIGMLPFVFGISGLQVWLTNSEYGATPVSSVLFIVSVAGLFLGQYANGGARAVFQDIQMMMIAPVWLLSNLYRRLGIPF